MALAAGDQRQMDFVERCLFEDAILIDIGGFLKWWISPKCGIPKTWVSIPEWL